MAKSGQHVVVRGGRWAVIKSGASRATRTFGSKDAAVNLATELAGRQNSTVYVHDKSGLIRQRIIPSAVLA